MEDKKALKSTAIVRNATNTIQDWVDDFLSNGVVATSIIVCCVLFASYQLFWMEELLICPSADLILRFFDEKI